MQPCTSTTPSLLGWWLNSVHLLHMQLPLQAHLISSSITYNTRVTLMAPQITLQVSLVTLPWQMDHYTLSSSLQALLPTLVLHSMLDLLFCYNHHPLASCNCWTLYLPLCDPPRCHLIPRTWGRSLRASSRSVEIGHTPYTSHPCCTCPCHTKMAQHFSPPPSEDIDRKPPFAPPMTSATSPLPPNMDATSSSSPTPLPHPLFTDVHRETILALRQNNAEMKFCLELMEKRLDWLLDSGAQDPTQSCTTGNLLYATIEPKWLDSFEHAFPYSYTSK